MSITHKTLKSVIGMRRSYFAKILSEPANSHPVYDDPVSMGEGVKCALAVTTAQASIYGDDVDLLDIEEFASAQADVETACDDLETNATLFGHEYDANGEELSGGDDSPPIGAYAYIQHLIRKDKTHVYRGVFFYRVSAMPSSEGKEVNTRTDSLDPKMNPVSFKLTTDQLNKWRARREFASQALAEAWIESKFGVSATTYTVTFSANGHGTAPEAQSVTAGDVAVEPAEPTASGWSFTGWYTDPACTDEWNFATPITHGVTLYAGWAQD